MREISGTSQASGFLPDFPILSNIVTSTPSTNDKYRTLKQENEGFDTGLAATTEKS